MDTRGASKLGSAPFPFLFYFLYKNLRFSLVGSREKLLFSASIDCWLLRSAQMEY